eukprot:7425831-Pyramimonas_sp.AAC.2
MVDSEAYLAKFVDPFGVCVDADGSVVVADTHNHRLRLVAANLTPCKKLVQQVTTINNNKPSAPGRIREEIPPHQGWPWGG